MNFLDRVTLSLCWKMYHFTEGKKFTDRQEALRYVCACLPVVNVVVLSSPAPVLIWEAVDLQKLFFTEA